MKAKGMQKRVIGMCLIIALGMSLLAGCSGKKEKKGREPIKREPYVEELVTLPEGAKGISAMTQLEDGTIRIVTTDTEGGNGIIWNSTDGGATWEQFKELKDTIIGEMGESVYMQTYLGPLGEVFNIYYDYSDEQQKPITKHFFTSASGEVKEVTFQLPDYRLREGEEVPEGEEGLMVNEVTTGKVLNDGQLLVADYNGDTHLIEIATGTIVRTFTLESEEGYPSYVSNIDVVDNKLMVESYDQSAFFDLESGNQLKKEKGLEEALKNDNQMGEGVLTRFAKNPKNKELFLCNLKGVYSYKEEKEDAKRIFNGANYSLSDSGTRITGFTVLGEKEFLVAQESYTNSGVVGQLYKYTYSKDVSATYDKELIIYSLEDNMDVRQAMSVYRKKNPNTKLTLQIAYSGEDAKTITDTLRTLNTEIMAGNGPDVLFFDGMAVDSYIEKDVLVDLKDIVKEVEKSEGMFKNIAKAYEKDGKIYAVPSRFFFVVVQGEEELVKSGKNLTSLADQLEKMKKERPEEDILNRDYGDLIQTLTYVGIQDCIKKDGSLDEKALKDFYTQLKRIHDVTTVPEGSTPEDILRGDEADAYSSMIYSTVGSMGLFDKTKASIDIMGVWNIKMAEAARKGLDLPYEIINQDFGKLYLPTTTVGVNAKGSEIEESKKFVKTLLSKEAQSTSQFDGYPVNKTGFDKVLDSRDEKGELVEMTFSMSEDGEPVTVKSMDKDEIKAFSALVDTLDKPVAIDNKVFSTVAQYGTEYVSGKTDLDKAVKAVSEKVGLYLAE